MGANGRLSGSELSSIPGGRLRHDAANAWNRMRKHIGEKSGVWIAPTGSQSSYRDIGGQNYFWNLYQSGRGNLAARPGSSNHGYGLAVDVATPQMARLINQYGAPFGYQKRWSDAPSEWWHMKYAPAEDRNRADPKKKKPKPKHPSQLLGPNEAKHRIRLKKARKAKNGAAIKREKDALRRSRAGIKKAAKGKGGWTAKHRKARYDYLGRLIRGTAKK